MGFNNSKIETSLYFQQSDKGLFMIIIYVDDLVLIGNKDMMRTIKTKLQERFKCTDDGELKYILGIRVTRNRNEKTIVLDQRGYIDDILRTTGMEECHGRGTPMQIGMPNLLAKPKDECDAPLLAVLNGKLQYLVTATRPDLAYTLSILAQYSATATRQHWNAMKHVLRYLKQTKNLGLRISGSLMDLKIFSDADWASDLDRLSWGGYVLVSDGAISWKAKKQKNIANSSTTAEYYAANQATNEAIWVINLCDEIGLKIKSPMDIMLDNQGAIALGKNPESGPMTKHIDIQYHYFREKVRDKRLNPIYVHTSTQLADGMTKALAGPAHENMVNRLGLVTMGEC